MSLAGWRRELSLQVGYPVCPALAGADIWVFGEDWGRLFDLNGSRGLPYDLREGIDLNSSSFFVLETDWNSTEAQEFPFGVVVVSNETISQKLNESNVFYVGGSLGDQIVGFRTR